MEFNNDRPIYTQIVDYAYDRIVRGIWRPGERVPSIRELAVAMCVNTHTVLHAYETLLAQSIIEVRRGLGYFLSVDAQERVWKERHQEFFERVMRGVIADMDALCISPDEIIEWIRANYRPGSKYQ